MGAFPAIDTVDRCLQSTVSGGRQHLLTVFEKLESHLRMGQGLQLHGGSHPAALHGVGFHEFHPGRGIEKEVANHNGGAVRAANFRFFPDVSGFQQQAGAGEIAGSLGHQLNAADGGNGSQSFATEAHGADGR